MPKQTIKQVKLEVKTPQMLKKTTWETNQGWTQSSSWLFISFILFDHSSETAKPVQSPEHLEDNTSTSLVSMGLLIIQQQVDLNYIYIKTIAAVWLEFLSFYQSYHDKMYLVNAVSTSKHLNWWCSQQCDRNLIWKQSSQNMIKKKIITNSIVPECW